MIGRLLLRAFGIRERTAPCPHCGRPMEVRYRTPAERYVSGDLTFEEFEHELDRPIRPGEVFEIRDQFMP